MFPRKAKYTLVASTVGLWCHQFFLRKIQVWCAGRVQYQGLGVYGAAKQLAQRILPSCQG